MMTSRLLRFSATSPRPTDINPRPLSLSIKWLALCKGGQMWDNQSRESVSAGASCHLLLLVGRDCEVHEAVSVALSVCMCACMYAFLSAPSSVHHYCCRVVSFLSSPMTSDSIRVPLSPSVLAYFSIRFLGVYLSHCLFLPLLIFPFVSFASVFSLSLGIILSVCELRNS